MACGSGNSVVSRARSRRGWKRYSGFIQPKRFTVSPNLSSSAKVQDLFVHSEMFCEHAILRKEQDSSLAGLLLKLDHETRRLENLAHPLCQTPRVADSEL